ncbi:MAG: Gfo/Idh/MocA family oxidoreductase [Armatimonadota bacterium]|nr:Gfo/Idh/MocA family oxidoreductase [Armatimonadota bacterium]
MAAQKSSDVVRVGIIGAGIGRAHIKGYNKSPNAKVVAVCDLNEERARAVARDEGVEYAQIFADYRKMLDEVELDAVSVGVPNLLHHPIAVDCSRPANTFSVKSRWPPMRGMLKKSRMPPLKTTANAWSARSTASALIPGF